MVAKCRRCHIWTIWTIVFCWSITTGTVRALDRYSDHSNLSRVIETVLTKSYSVPDSSNGAGAYERDSFYAKKGPATTTRDNGHSSSLTPSFSSTTSASTTKRGQDSTAAIVSGDFEKNLQPKLPRRQTVYPVLLRNVSTLFKTSPDDHWVPGRRPQIPDVPLSSVRLYRFAAFNKTFFLRLHPDARFLAPSFKGEPSSPVNSTNQNRDNGDHTFKEPRSCFYVGMVVGDPESHASLGVCHGLFGLIHTSDGDFTIEPELFTGPVGGTRIPHIFAQITTKNEARDASGDGLRNSPSSKVTCDVQDSAPISNTKRKRKKSKKWKTETGEGKRNKKGWHRRNNYREKTTSGRKREKRSISNELHLELMLVTDKKMQEMYGRNLERYILTLMSTVAYVYRHPSIGNDISIALVKHRRLTDEESRNVIGPTATQTLGNFCKWQSEINSFDENDPHHFDVAILLTREDLCRSYQSCDVLGLAQKGLVCDPKHNCAIVEDSGLSASFTIIHELGHILSMPHDHDYGQDGDCSPHLGPGRNLHVMSRMLDFNSHSWSWSACSRHHFTNLLDSGLGFCLMDKPREDLLLTPPDNKLPGEIYDVDYQCYLQFGPKYRVCRKDNTTCVKLWCSLETETSTTCRTAHSAWADGSNCTTNHLAPMWCREGKCVPVRRETGHPVDGAWSEWKSDGECSRPCGGGIKRSIRECDNPKPTNGGKFCLGVRTRYHSCNIHDCPPNTADFREQQCAKFNGKVTMNNAPPGLGWVPETRSLPPSDVCKLYCRLGSEIRRLQEKVIDGTPCGMEPGSYSLCVNGLCVEPGCDRILGSLRKFDICGKCGGDNSTCKVIKGAFNEANYGYNNVVIIPPGSTYIEIMQYGYNNRKDDNYLVLKDRNGANILNGNFNVTMTKKLFYYGDVLVQYTGSSADVERINITKPIQKELIVQVLIVGAVDRPDVRYQYTISSQDENEFDWEYEPKWQPCNRVCGGEQFRDPLCVRRVDKLIVSEGHCRKEKKLPRKAQACNLNCELKWYPIQLSQCSSLCGPGTLKRVFNCAQFSQYFHKHQHILPDHVCFAQLGPKPPENEDCEGSCLDSKWEYGEWSPCSKSCGGGEQFRSAHCVSNQGHKHEDSHCDQSKMITSHPCNMGECPSWETDTWTECSVSCGTGERQRPYFCQHGGLKVANHFCDPEKVPEHKEKCVVPCHKWQLGPWSACSVTCGDGIQRRTVQCQSEEGQAVNNSSCDLFEKPFIEINCRRTPCTATPSPSNYHWSISPADQSGSVMAHSRYRVVWRTGPFGECSRTCGGGTMRRQVVCSADRLSLESCGPKPPEEMPCNEQPCPMWAMGEWETCSNNCGAGTQNRTLKCTDHLGQVVQDFQCLPYEKPSITRKCQGHNCYDFGTTTIPTSIYRWHTEAWSQCCNGTARRQVICIDQNEISVPVGRCEGPAPKKRRPCEGSNSDTRLCPRWVKMEDWSQCFGSCGNSTQTQTWLCRSGKGQSAVDEEWCDQPKPKPVTRPCLLKHCSYHWAKKKWTKCSSNCGTGKRRRHVYCEQANDSIVDENYCAGMRKPKTEKKCRSQTCPFSWVTSHWSECSRSCGPGTQRRMVSCHKANGYGWVDPVPVPQPRISPSLATWCNVSDKPSETRSCNLGSCQSRSLWKAGPWQPCSVECGRGRQHRRVKCLDRRGRKLNKDQCDIKLKPKNKRRCVMKSCHPTTCLDIKKHRNVNTDGEYTLHVRGKNIRVYCKDMNKGHPREFITLNSESDNYSVVYRKLNSATCSNSRYYGDSCGCPEQFLVEEGRTTFKRIAINITSLRVYPYNFLFSHTTGTDIPYGQSNCSHQYRCPQSKFRLNLQGTGLRISPDTRWVSHGGKLANKIQKMMNGQAVQGKCGGICGSCIPSPEVGLRLDVSPP